MIGPVRLYSHIALEGAGPQTILRKSEGVRTRFVVDADYGMMKITVADPSGFTVGSGLQLSDDLHNQGWQVTTAMVTAVDGNVLYLDNSTVHDYIASQNGTISNAFSLVEAVGAEDVRIAHLRVEGNKATNDYINGCRGGGIYIHKSRNCVIENVHVNEFNGDSFSWQITENITVRNCMASNGDGLGFHPGTGSHHSIVESNISRHNALDGIYLCWRVQHSVFRKNLSYGNGENGISIGHQDTDNVFEDNQLYENGMHGVLFRDETFQNSGHRNTFRNNIIENNGTAQPSYGFFVGGNTQDISIEHNVIRSSGQGGQQAAIFIGRTAKDVQVRDNVVSGHQEIVRE